jgi:hypothetical protein
VGPTGQPLCRLVSHPDWPSWVALPVTTRTGIKASPRQRRSEPLPCPRAHSDRHVRAPRRRPRSEAACHRCCLSSPPSPRVSAVAPVLLRSRPSCLTLFRRRAAFSVTCCRASRCPFSCAGHRAGLKPSSAATPRPPPRHWSSMTSRFCRRCLGWVPRRAAPHYLLL